MNPAGSITWGIKESFREYVSGLPDGEISLEAGATQDSGGEFSLPLAAATAGEYATDARVTLSGHGGHMSVVLEALTVQVAGGAASILVGVPATRIARAVVVERQADKLTLAPTITTLGSEWLGGAYVVGTELDTLVIKLAHHGELPDD